MLQPQCCPRIPQPDPTSLPHVSRARTYVTRKFATELSALRFALCVLHVAGLRDLYTKLRAKAPDHRDYFSRYACWWSFVLNKNNSAATRCRCRDPFVFSAWSYMYIYNICATPTGGPLPVLRPKASAATTTLGEWILFSGGFAPLEGFLSSENCHPLARIPSRSNLGTWTYGAYVLYVVVYETWRITPPTHRRRQ